MQQEPAHASAAEAPASAGLPPPSHEGLLSEVGQFGRAIKHLFGAQWQLLKAEMGLARSAMSALLLAGVAAALAGFGLLLTVLALAAVLLAQWLGSWVWALLILAGLQLVLLVAAALFCRRCIRWMSLPETRNQWSAMMGDITSQVRRQGEGEDA